MAKGNRQKSSDGSALDFEAQLWAAADKMRGHMDASGYNGARPEGLCLGLVFLKYISDAFEEKREQLLFGFSDPKSEWFIKDEPDRADAAENRDITVREAKVNSGATFSWQAWEAQYLAANVFWLPPEARWHTINARAKSPEIGKVIDDAMGAIERENPTLKGVLPRDTSCVNRQMNRAFSLSASTGERVGVRCRNFGMNRRVIQSVRGQRWPCASTTTWKLARMNLAIRGIDANLGPRNADSFRADLHPDLKADFILATPP